jgi:uncharacterized protein (DUF3084 family)
MILWFESNAGASQWVRPRCFCYRRPRGFAFFFDAADPREPPRRGVGRADRLARLDDLARETDADARDDGAARRPRVAEAAGAVVQRSTERRLPFTRTMRDVQRWPAVARVTRADASRRAFATAPRDGRRTTSVCPARTFDPRMPSTVRPKCRSGAPRSPMTRRGARARALPPA